MSLPTVLFVLPQSGAAADGGIASISEIIRRLRHHRAVIVTDRDTAQVERWRSDGIETHVIPKDGMLSSYWRHYRELRRLIASSGAKVIHANKPFALQLALPAARLSGAKVVLNLRDTRDPARPPSSARIRFLFGAADHILFLSHDMADRWARVAPNAKTAFTVTYSIVDRERFRPQPRGDGPPAVLLSGVIREKKGQLDFLRHVAPALAAHGIETWLAGDFEPSRNAYMRACAEAAAPLGEAVRFLGYRTDVPELMARSSVVAIASRHEGLVRAMIEAMACARPVVSFDVCSAREVLEQEARGAGVVVNDFEAMTDAILRYCRDPAAAEAAGEKGCEAASRLFDPDAVVERYERVYEKLAAGR